MRAWTIMLCAAAMGTGCVEDSLLGTNAAGVELPRGLTRDLSMSTTSASPALSAYMLDVDDPAIARVSLSADGHHLEVTALSEGTTQLHLTYREAAIHVQTTVLPAQVVGLAVQPTDVSAPIGGIASVAVMATNTADEVVDATALVVWTVDDPLVARVREDGVHGMASGVTAIHATIDGTSSSATVSIGR